MAPVHGSKSEIYYNGYDVSTFLHAVGISSQVDKADASTFKTTMKKYTIGLKDDTWTADGWFDGTPQAIDDLMFAAQSAGFNLWQWWPTGRSFGAPGYSINATSTKYEVKTDIGSTASVSMEASGKNTDRIISLAADVTVASSANGTSYDNTAASTRAGYLIVHGTTTGGTMTVVLQDSADNSTFADIATATFTGGTGIDPAEAAYRIVTTSNPRCYVRIRYSGAGTILTAAVAF